MIAFLQGQTGVPDVEPECRSGGGKGYPSDTVLGCFFSLEGGLATILKEQ